MEYSLFENKKGADGFVLRPWCSLLLSVLSGVLIAYAHRDPQYYLFGWFGFVPVLCAIKNRTPFECYAYGSVSGTVLNFFALPWMTNLMANFMNLPFPYNWGLFALYAILFGQNLGLILFLTGYLSKKIPNAGGILFPVAHFMVYNWIPNIFFSRIGETQLHFTMAIQMTEFFGAKGLSLLIYAFNFYVSELFFIHRFPVIKWQILIFSGVLAAWFFFGIRSYHHWKEDLAKWNREKIGIVQPNQPILFKSGRSFKEIVQSYEIKASLELAKANPKVIIWPEGIQYNLRNSKIRKFFRDFLIRLKTPLVAQGFYYGKNGESYNSTFLFDRQGNVANRYDKIKLMPFGEVFPFVNVINFILQPLDLRVASFARGAEQRSFNIEGFHILPRICYESLFPEFIAEGMQKTKKKETIVFLTESEWYDSEMQISQHAGISAFRAVENRTALLHVINGGKSNIILPTGETLFEAPYHQKGAFLQEIPVAPESPLTFYARYPHLVAYLVNGLFLFFLVTAFFRGKTSRGSIAKG